MNSSGYLSRIRLELDDLRYYGDSSQLALVMFKFKLSEWMAGFRLNYATGNII